MRVHLAAGAVALILAVPSVAHAGGGGELALPGGAFQFIVQDATFDGPGCALVQWSAKFSKPAGTIFDATFSLRQISSNQEYAEDAIFEYSDDVGSRSGAICVDDAVDVTQGYFVFETSWSLDPNNGPETSGTLPAVPVTVTQNPSQFLSFKVPAKKAYKLGYLRGRVVATAPTKGRIGAGGTLSIERLRKGTWRTFLDRVYIDQYGRFAGSTYERITSGTKFRARLTDCGWCTDAVTTTPARAR